MYTTRIGKSQSQGKSHLSHEEDTRALQLEVDHLKRKLRREQRKRTPSSSNSSFNNEKNGSYRCRSRTPPSESFSYVEDHYRERKNRSSVSKGQGNDALSKVLNQISRSPFTRRIEEGMLPQPFTQPTFTMYSGRTDPVEHVSHFN